MQPSFGYNLLNTKFNYFILLVELLSIQFQLSTLCIISNNFRYNLLNMLLFVKKFRSRYAFTLKAKRGSFVRLFGKRCLHLLFIIIF